MYWQDQNENKNQFVVPDDITDLSFKVQCRQLPLDHAYALSQAIQKALPWFAGEPQAGIHLIHGAESGNGWMRPQHPDALLNLSRRTRFTLRLPRHCIAAASKLVDRTLDVDGHALVLSNPQRKPLTALTTIFSRYIIGDSGEDEEVFLHKMVATLEKEGIRVKKVMSGRVHMLRTPEEGLYTRSLMLAGLTVEESIHLQQHGLGAGRKLGCGLFLPHKGIDATGGAQEK